jgi:hypothetical protein
MRRGRSLRQLQRSTKNPQRRTRTRVGMMVAALAAAVVLILSLTAGTPLSASAQSQAKRYKATRAFVVDKQSGAVRMPTQQEVDEVVANLTALGQRPTEDLQQSAQPSGTVTVDLDGGLAACCSADRTPTARGRRNASSLWKKARSSWASSKTSLLDKGDTP